MSTPIIILLIISGYFLLLLPTILLGGNPSLLNKRPWRSIRNQEELSDRSRRLHICKYEKHIFHVGRSGYYQGLPQSHCYRCGIRQRRHDGIHVSLWTKPGGLVTD